MKFYRKILKRGFSSRQTVYNLVKYILVRGFELGKIYIVGLGPSDADQLTKKALEAIHSGRKNFLRTDQHESVNYFKDNEIPYLSFDGLYQKLDSFDQIYTRIYQELIQAAEKEDINYLVPGSPMIAEKTVKMLLDKLGPDQYEVIQGLSFLEPVFTLCQLDPVEGFILVDGDNFHWTDFNPHLANLVTQVYNARILADLKLSLGEIYGDDHEVFLVSDAGLKSQKVDRVKVHALDRCQASYQTSLLVPKLAQKKNWQDLAKVMEELRGRHGCPWDLEQTHESICPDMIEESYEAVDAIKSGDLDQMVEELGDVLFQVYFHSQIAYEEGEFNLYDIWTQVTNKLIHRHPHVFDQEKYDEGNWDRIKDQSRGFKTFAQRLEDIRGLPALMRAQKITYQTGKIGFFWKDAQEVFSCVQEEMDELAQALAEGDSNHIQEEIGDVFYSLVNLCYALNYTAEDIMHQACKKIIHRLAKMEELAMKDQLDFQHLDFNQLENYWKLVKKIEK